MKVILSFKTPDVVFQATEGLNEDEKDEIESACKKWIEYDEYLVVEIDTETGECKPIPVGE